MKVRSVVLLVCSAVCLMSCAQPRPREAIIGTWEESAKAGAFTSVSQSGPGVMTFEFKPDGTLITQGGVATEARTVDGKTLSQGGSDPVTNRYVFVDDQTIKISFAKGLLFEGLEVTMKVSASRNTITLTETAPSKLKDLGVIAHDGTLFLQRVR